MMKRPYIVPLNAFLYFFNELSIQQAPVEDLASVNGQLSLDECPQAISSINNVKAPESDGLSANFYKLFGI